MTDLGRLRNADHNMICAEVLGSVPDIPSKQLFPNWKKANFSKMREILGEIDWLSELSPLNPAEKWEYIKNSIDSATNSSVPMVPRRESTKPFWMTLKPQN